MNKRRFSIWHTLGTIGSATFILLAVIMGGEAGFINIPSAMITFGIPFFLLCGIYREQYLKFLPDALLTLFSAPPDRPLNDVFRNICKTAAQLMIASGVIGTLIGIIQMLRNLTDPSTLGAGMAVALITVLYAALGAELYSVLLMFAYSRRSKVQDDLSLKGCAWTAGCTILALIIFCTLINFMSRSGTPPDHYRKTLHIELTLPGNTAPTDLALWCSCDTLPALQFTEEHCSEIRNETEHFLSPLAADQFQNAVTEKRLEIHLMEYLNTQLRKHNIPGQLSDISLCGLTDN